MPIEARHDLPPRSIRFLVRSTFSREQPPEPGLPERAPEPDREPYPEPWHDPGPPVREVDLPPNTPSRGIPVENPELPRRDSSR